MKQFENQVGGHKGDAAMLKSDDGASILKPFNFQEWLLYENLAYLSKFPDMVPCKLFPQYHGRRPLRLREGHAMSEWLVMENLCMGMQHPSILDLKVGASSYGHTKSGLVKQAKQTVVHAISTSQSLGFRVAGMKTWRGEQKGYDEKEKKYGLTLSAKNVAQAFREFFTPEDVYRIDLADMFLARLRIVREFMATQTFLSLNSSSLLFLYDTETNKVDLRMVSLFFVFHLLLRSKFARAD